MVYALTDFVGIPSVTASESHREYCRQAAIWLQACLAQLGGEAFLVSSLYFQSTYSTLVIKCSHRLRKTAYFKSRGEESACAGHVPRYEARDLARGSKTSNTILRVRLASR